MSVCGEEVYSPLQYCVCNSECVRKKLYVVAVVRVNMSVCVCHVPCCGKQELR